MVDKQEESEYYSSQDEQLKGDKVYTMEHEYRVLSHLQENEITTQREISSGTGLSLGAVNLLLKKMVRKGLVKIERLNARSMRYILTPKGMQEKARLTYRYIRQSYRQLLKINHALDQLLIEHAAGLDGEEVMLYGPEDEMREILIQHLNDRNFSYKLYNDQEIAEHLSKMENTRALAITWREEEEEKMQGPVTSINIMKML